jgi:hypothetical protein
MKDYTGIAIGAIVVLLIVIAFIVGARMGIKVTMGTYGIDRNKPLQDYLKCSSEVK